MQISFRRTAYLSKRAVFDQQHSGDDDRLLFWCDSKCTGYGWCVCSLKPWVWSDRMCFSFFFVNSFFFFPMKWADLKMINMRQCSWIAPIGGDRFHFLLYVQASRRCHAPFQRQTSTTNGQQLPGFCCGVVTCSLQALHNTTRFCYIRYTL